MSSSPEQFDSPSDTWERRRLDYEQQNSPPPPEQPEAIASLVDYLAGAAPAPEGDFSRRELQDAWQVIQQMAEKDKPAGWQKRFREIQPDIARGEKTAAIDRNLLPLDPQGTEPMDVS